MQCPHCLQHFAETWNAVPIAKENAEGGSWWVARATRCAACNRSVIDLGQGNVVGSPQGQIVVAYVPLRLIHPRVISRAPTPPEVPVEFKTDYCEACLVLPDSEKASAALSRRCLQHLLREKAGVQKNDLAKEIQQVLDSKQLPSLAI